MKQLPLSVVIIAQDEEANLGRCLESVGWAQERLVVDGGSKDRTIEIARRYGARVIEKRFRDYAEQKNVGVDAARFDWVLSLDADEWLDDDVYGQIAALFPEPTRAGYRLRRKTAFCGAYVRAWAKDAPLRLFDRRRGRFAGGPVHESVRMNEGVSIDRLDGPILHLGYRSIGEYIARMNRYTSLAADGLHADGVKPRPLRWLTSSTWVLVKQLVLRGGIFDGWRGWTVAVGSAAYVALREFKLWERGSRRAGSSDDAR